MRSRAMGECIVEYLGEPVFLYQVTRVDTLSRLTELLRLFESVKTSLVLVKLQEYAVDTMDIVDRSWN